MFNFIKNKNGGLSLRRSKATGKGESSVFKAGFTLVELLVTIVIFVLVTGVVLVNANKFDNSVLLNNLTYDVALTIKQAQSYGANVKENNLGSFDTPYGVYFNLGQSTTSFVLFTNNSSTTGSVTSCGVPSDCVQRYTMRNGIYISDICTSFNNGPCNDPATGQLSMVFVRPKLTAYIYADKSAQLQDYAKITLSSANDVTSSVIITKVGQIYVKK